MSRTQVRRRRGVLVVVGLAIGLGFLGGRASAGPSAPVASRVAVVHQGDTVWGIARSIVGPSADPRPMVQELIDANHLHGGVITLGQRLIVPSR